MTRSEEPAYSPRLRTGVILCGSGTAGAYHAGALQALTEAGIKIDVLAAHGTGALTALAAAVDGGPRVWGEGGPWTSRRLLHAYRWRAAFRFAALGLVLASLLLVSPALVLVAAATIYALSFLSALVNLTGVSAWFVGFYRRFIELLFDPPILPTVLPRALLLALLVIALVLVVAAVRAIREEGARRRWRGGFWWHLLTSPLDAQEPGATCI